jgi:hypothetical protein
MASTDSTVTTFHKNPTKHWVDNVHLSETFGGQNPQCRIHSKSCSTEMSDISDLCKWHRLRMGQHIQEHCGCKLNDICFGDATARYMFRSYYDRWDLPVIDMTGKLYCCGSCQNGDRETHECGQMLVGPCCVDKHPNATRFKYFSESEDSDE